MESAPKSSSFDIFGLHKFEAHIVPSSLLCLDDDSYDQTPRSRYPQLTFSYHKSLAASKTMHQRVALLPGLALVAASSLLLVSAGIPHLDTPVDVNSVFGSSHLPPQGAALRRGDQNPSHQRRKLFILSPIISFFSLIRSVINWVLSLLGLPTIGNDEVDDPTFDPIPSPVNQFTPNPADWSTFYSTVDASPDVIDHTPDGVLWLTSNDWVQWDGTTTYDPTTMSHQDFASTICPSSDTILGLREVFYQTNPFADPHFPTKAEVDLWHSVALTHLRQLVGIDLPAVRDHCMFARALWGQERKLSTKWDEEYPEGKCEAGSDLHCGHSFLPSAEDQVSYLPEGHPACGLGGGAEGISSAAKVNIPWSIKWVRVFCSLSLIHISEPTRPY